MVYLIIQRRIVTRLRTYTVAPVDAIIGHHRWHKGCARCREKDFGVVVKTAGGKTVQRLAAQNNALEASTYTLNAEHV